MSGYCCRWTEVVVLSLIVMIVNHSCHKSVREVCCCCHRNNANLNFCNKELYCQFECAISHSLNRKSWTLCCKVSTFGLNYEKHFLITLTFACVFVLLFQINSWNFLVFQKVFLLQKQRRQCSGVACMSCSWPCFIVPFWCFADRFPPTWHKTRHISYSVIYLYVLFNLIYKLYLIILFTLVPWLKLIVYTCKPFDSVAEAIDECENRKITYKNKRWVVFLLLKVTWFYVKIMLNRQR